MAVTGLLEMEKGSFFYTPGVTVFGNISFSVDPGEIFCILGPNGCGKTTLLDTLLGYLELKEGRIFLNGQDANGMKRFERARHLAYVPQNHAKTFPYTVFDIILMGRSSMLPFHAAPGKEDRERTEEIISMMNLNHLARKEYTKISGGETQLVLIARALVQESRVIIMDEPSSHLDFTNELVILETMARLVKEKGISVVMATHLPNHAFYFDNRGLKVQTALMNQGAFYRCGPPAEVLSPDNLEAVYSVETKVLTFAMEQNSRSMNHIVPIALRRKKDA